jgi:hypothetical protein
MPVKRLRLLSFLLAVILTALASGCARNNPIESGKQATPLSDEELAYFNGDTFFNGVYPNMPNQFLSSLYETPEKLELFQLFYNGSSNSEAPSDAETLAVIEKNGWDTAPDCACIKITRADMDAVLTEYTGLTLETTDKTGLEQFTYLETYDAYYNYHGDTNYRGSILFSGGEREGDLIRLFYDDTFYGDGEKVLTLKEQDGSCLFVSNLKADGDAVTSSDNTPSPSNTGTVPEAVLDAANRYMQMQLDYWNTCTGAWSMVDGKEQMVGEPASFDTWRLDGLSLAASYTELDGKPVNDFRQSDDVFWSSLDVYRLDYRLHTTTPDKVLLAGGMNLDDDNWLWVGSPYLIFASVNGSPTYVLALTDESTPENKIFTRDLSDRLTAAKDAHAESLAQLRALFDDGESAIWYLPAGESQPGPVPAELSYVRRSDQQYEERYAVLFSGVWERAYQVPEPAGASLCLGDSPERCFRFYLGSDLVYRYDGETVTAWRANASGGLFLPDAMMLDFSGYEVDIANVTIPVLAGETAADTLRRFSDAYGQYLLGLTPENIYRITDIKMLDSRVMQTKDTRFLSALSMAVKPPEALYETTFWWAGNSVAGEGELTGWLVMSREMILEQSDSLWRCTGFGTGGYSLHN